jgi:outer membrane receptor protein involved in Fe transport
MDRQPVSWESNTHDWQIDLQGVIRPFADHIFTTGMEFLSNKVEFGDLTNKINKTVIEKGHSDRITNAGAYIQDEWTIGGRFHAVPGIRVDYHTVFGAAVSPKIGLSFNCTDKVRLRGSFGRAFRAPNHTELFMPPLPLKDTITLTSNPDLKPEYILATDGGVDVTPIRNLKLQWGLFYNNMKDLIGQGVRIDDIGKQYVTHDNISSAWSMGSELEAEWAIVKGVKVHGNYVLQKSRNVSATEIAKERSEVNPDADLPTDIRLDYIPSHKGGIGFVFSRKIGRIKLSFSADQLFVGSRTYQKFDELELTPEQVRIGFNEDGSIHVDANPKVVTLPWYNRTDLQMRYDFLYFWMTVSVQNLFNIHYEESFGTYVPGRLATVKIGAAW